MAEKVLVEHTGYIVKIGADQVTVRIISESACASCHAKGACSAADKQEKDIDVYAFGFENLKVGQSVIIQGEKSLGLRAATYAYIIPFFLVILTLFISFGITHNEGLSGILSLVVLVPYYLILKYYTPKLKSAFTFTLKRIVE